MKFTRKDFIKVGTLAGLAITTSGKNLSGHSLQIAGVTRPNKQKTIVTTCNMCYLGCSVLATYENDKILHLRGNPASPINHGKLCAKGHAGIYKSIHPERLGYPLIRAGKRGEGKWKKVSWDRALGVISESIQKIRKDFGDKSVALWQNVNMDRPDIFKRFIYSIGSPNYISHVSTCNSSQLIGSALTSGIARQNYDYPNAECIVFVGVNPFAAKEMVYSTRKIMEARERGARLITLDPRMSETAARSDIWLPIIPGTDGIFLAGLSNWLIQNNKYDSEYVSKHAFGFNKIRRYLKQFTIGKVIEASGISEKSFIETAEIISSRKTVVVPGRGLITHKDATDGMRMSEILNALLGSIDTKGGVMLMGYPPFKFGEIEPEIKMPGLARIDKSSADKIALPVGLKPENPAAFFGLSHNVPFHILNEKPYPLKAMIFNAVNPVYSLPEGDKLIRAFEKLELIVSMDAFMTETTQYADIILPASTYLEGLDIWLPHGAKIALRQPVIQPRLESKPSQEIIIALAKKMGLTKEFPFQTYEDFLKLQLKDSGISYEELKQKGFISYTEEELKPGKLLQNGFKTASGKIELVSSVLSYSGFSPEPKFQKWNSKEDEKFPFNFVTYKLPFHTQSATGENPYLAGIKTFNPVYIHPATASMVGVLNGENIMIESKRGKIKARVKISESIRPDTIAMSHHFGHTAYSNICNGRGINANKIIDNGTDPLGGNATYNDTKVRIEKI